VEVGQADALSARRAGLNALVKAALTVVFTEGERADLIAALERPPKWSACCLMRWTCYSRPTLRASSQVQAMSKGSESTPNCGDSSLND
jgi:hypothetical protein